MVDEDAEYDLAEGIKSARAKSRLTIPQLSNRTGLPPWTLEAFERGDQEPTMEQLLRISHGLGVDVESLMPERRGGTSEEVDLAYQDAAEYSDVLGGLASDPNEIEEPDFGEIELDDPPDYSGLD